MVFYSLPLFFILRSVEMIQRRHYECIRFHIGFIFSRDPSCLYDPSSCRVYYYDRQFDFFQDVTTNTMTQKVMQSLGLSVFTTAFLPGLVEEILFRGVLYSRLRKANPIKGILLSALLFGIAHMNFQQFSYAFFLGIVFGCLLEATDSIFATITAHMIFNGSSILLTYAISKVSLFGVNNLDTANTVTVSSIIASIPVALIGLILSIFLLVAIAYLNGRLGYIKTWFQKDIRQTWPKKRVTNISFWAAFIVCFLFSIMMEITSSFL